MFKKDAEIINSLGIHARPASMIVKVASTFDSKVELEKNNVRVNAKSIMGVLMLASEQGDKVTIIAEGKDEKEAVESLIKLIEIRKFDEE
jgi:phosphocarrier protein HPr